jgi:hypothetical protein
VVTRGSLDRGTEPVFAYRREPSYGTFETRNAAKIAVMVSLSRELEGAPESFVLLHWRQMARNLRWFRVRKVSSP